MYIYVLYKWYYWKVKIITIFQGLGEEWRMKSMQKTTQASALKLPSPRWSLPSCLRWLLPILAVVNHYDISSSKSHPDFFSHFESWFCQQRLVSTMEDDVTKSQWSGAPDQDCWLHKKDCGKKKVWVKEMQKYKMTTTGLDLLISITRINIFLWIYS